MVLKRKLLCFIAGLVFAAGLFGLEVPEFKGRVNDYAKIINKETTAELESYLEALDNQTGVQMVVLTIPSLDGDDLASFAIRTAEKWQIGHAGKDNGALLLVALAEHSVRIEVGYGLEGELTDAKCGLIIRNVIIPEFKNDNYSAGILKGIKNMGGIASGDASLVDEDVQNDTEDDDTDIGAVVMAIWLIFIFTLISGKQGLLRWFILTQILRRPYTKPKRNYTSGNSSSFSSSSFGSSSHSSFSSSSHSSFSGGGGHFGGGGASGHW